MHCNVSSALSYGCFNGVLQECVQPALLRVAAVYFVRMLEHAEKPRVRILHQYDKRSVAALIQRFAAEFWALRNLFRSWGHAVPNIQECQSNNVSLKQPIEKGIRIDVVPVCTFLSTVQRVATRRSSIHPCVPIQRIATAAQSTWTCI